MADLLRELAGHNIEPDERGDFIFHGRTSTGCVSVLDSNPIRVRVAVLAAIRIKRSLRLLNELNDINTRSDDMAMAVWWRGDVLIAADVLAAQLTFDALRYAVRVTSDIADKVGPMIALVHGGSVPYQREGGEEGPASSDAG